MNTEQQKTNGEHIIELAAMKFYNNENWEFQLAGALPTGFREVLAAEIDRFLIQYGRIVKKLATDEIVDTMTAKIDEIFKTGK
jgi:hypothetical protein